jgi:hypothetical protein
MKTRSKIHWLRTFSLLAVILVPAAIFGQATEHEKHVAELKLAVQQSMAGLKRYEWIETTTVSLKGEVKSQKQNRCYYGVDGKIQKVPIGEAPQQQSSGRRGRLKSRVIAKKKGELTEYMKQAVDLVRQYVPPDPALIQYSKDVKKVAVEPFEPNKVVRVSFHDFIKTGDLLSATFNIQSNTILDINVSTWLESQKDGVTLAVGFTRLPDGTSYAGRTVLNAPSKHIKVVVENSGHRHL